MSWLNWLINLFKTSGLEQPSPSDIVPASSIIYLQTAGRVEINITNLNIPFTKPPKVWIVGVASNSLDPVMDVGHNNIFIAGADEANHKILLDFIKVGDLAVYRFPSDMSQPATAFINHRIVQIDNDSKGRYFRFKGDNNSSIDPFIVRDDNIKFVSLSVVY